MKFLGKLFIPQESNNYQPTILEKAAALGILLLIFLSFTVVNIQSLVLVSSDWFASAILPSVLIDLTNDSRKDEKMSFLTRSAVLDEAASLKARDMAEHEYFAHDSPLGITPWYWFERAGYDYVYAGENLAVHFTDSDQVVDAWMKSPGHRANILNEHYTEIGIGTARGTYKGAPTIFVVQLFGHPMTEAEKSRVAALTRAPKQAATIVASSTTIPKASSSASVLDAQDEQAVPVEEVQITTVAGTTSPKITRMEPIQDNVPTTTQATATRPELASVKDTSPTISQTQTFMTLSDVATISPFVGRGILSSDIGETSGNTAEIRQSTPLYAAATRPHLVLSIIYSLLALFVFCSLVLSIIVEWRRQHPTQLMYGIGLMVALWIALYVHSALVSGVLIV